MLQHRKLNNNANIVIASWHQHDSRCHLEVLRVSTFQIRRSKVRRLIVDWRQAVSIPSWLQLFAISHQLMANHMMEYSQLFGYIEILRSGLASQI